MVGYTECWVFENGLKIKMKKILITPGGDNIAVK